MDLIQSFVYSCARSKLTVYEQRIMMRIAQHAQSIVKGMKIKDNLFPWQHDFDNVFFSIKAKDILDRGSQHYEYVYSAVRSLQKRQVEFLSSDGSTWFCTPILYNAKLVKGSGTVQFFVSRTVFDVILDFSKGYRKYDLEAALSISSPFAARMYVLMNGTKRPLTFTVAALKKMFGVSEKYDQTADFIKKVIKPAQKYLDDAGMNSFTFSRVKTGNKVTALTFFAVVRVDESKKSQMAKTAVSFVMPKELMILLIQWAGFTIKELGAHKQLLEDFSKLPGCYQIIQEIVSRAKNRGKEKGYIIAAMRGEIKEFNDNTNLNDGKD